MKFGKIKFGRKKAVLLDPDEDKFNKMMALIKDLPKSDYERFKGAMGLGWQSYQKIRNVKTEEEKAIEKALKEDKDIEIAETILEKES